LGGKLISIIEVFFAFQLGKDTTVLPLLHIFLRNYCYLAPHTNRIMGIGAQSKAPRGQSGPLASSAGPSSTAAYTAPEVKGKAPVIVRSVSIAEAALPNPSSDTGIPSDQGDALPPSYNEEEEYKPNVLLKPSDDNDLNYFHAIATGEPWMRPPSSNILVMNVFRTTQCHVYPIDERIAMGSSLAQPYYALKSAPSTTSVDEFNKLTISRRHPDRARWTDAVISEISPRLNLLANGVMIIARINVLKPGNLIQKHDLTWEKARDSYTVWGNTGSGMKPVVEVRPDGWESLEDPTGDGGGVIRV
jgi:hypothetical protein